MLFFKILETVACRWKTQSVPNGPGSWKTKGRRNQGDWKVTEVFHRGEICVITLIIDLSSRSM
jgi:hypothetical protein